MTLLDLTDGPKVQGGPTGHGQPFVDIKTSAPSQDRLIIQRRASDHSQGPEDNNLGSSPGLLGQ